MTKAMEALRDRLAQLRDDIPRYTDAKLMHAAFLPVIEAMDTLPAADRLELRAELAGVISALEGQILALEQKLKDKQH